MWPITFICLTKLHCLTKFSRTSGLWHWHLTLVLSAAGTRSANDVTLESSIASGFLFILFYLNMGTMLIGFKSSYSFTISVAPGSGHTHFPKGN